MMDWRLAGLGAISGAITAGIGIACGDDHMLNAYYIAPGLVFGVIIGAGLWREGKLAGGRWLVYVAAAGLANALSVLLALRGVDLATRLVGNERGAVALIGLVAGAVGGGLLGLASLWLMGLIGAGRAAFRRWGWTVGTGALFGMLLPVLVEGEAPGALVFYVLWQAAYAAVTPAMAGEDGAARRA
jgi:hypothetical protein